MTDAVDKPLVLSARELRKTFRRDTGEIVQALDGISVTVAEGTLTALVGPDGAGKTTLIRLVAGLMTADGGELTVLSVDASADPAQIQARIGYMPQRFGLYEDLTVQENLDLYADLHGVGDSERRESYPRLMEMTALGPFTDRLAGRLSGGMKQKLGLACTLVRSPEFLLLDEPTVGVDPLSRRELWTIILQLVRDQNLTVLVSTSYLDEADRCEHAIVLHQGKILAQGSPAEVTAAAAGRTFLAEPRSGRTARDLQARLLGAAGIVDAVPEGGKVRLVLAQSADDESHNTAAAGDAKLLKKEALPEALSGMAVHAVKPRFEDGFMVLLRRTSGEQVAGTLSFDQPPPAHDGQPVIDVHDLVRMFGSFTAVDHINFDVRRGEIFGLLGPNGAGKTTTFRMLCGLLPASGGELRVAGVDVRSARASARQRIGYVAQKYSLYGQLSVRENLEFFASAYGLRGQRRRDRIDWAMEQFELGSFGGLASGQLPGGYKQRLAMAAALLHEPEILFLDEPTSGADPLARRDFWRRITSLAAQGVTVIVTTHFMEEAEYCDRVAIMDSGRILAQGSPGEIRGRARPESAGARESKEPGKTAREPNMEDAFIAIVEDSRDAESRGAGRAGGAA
jgi:ABC-2 type transport system ATP-binding protein